MATTKFQPPPTYALPVVEDTRTGKLIFNPIWLKWFLDLSQNLGVTGAGSGGVSSVSLTTPLGLTASGSPITATGTLGITFTAGYSIPTTASQTQWDTAYTDRYKWDGGSTGLVAATGRTSLGLVIGTDVQAYDADLITWAGITPGTGVGAALAVNVGTAGAVQLNNGSGAGLTSVDAATLGGATFASPGTIGGTVAGIVNGTTVNATTGNFVPATSGKGVDFSVQSSAVGMTSKVLVDYEEGVWVTTWTGLTGTPTSADILYTRVGRLVAFTYAAGAATISGTGNTVKFSLPFTPAKASVGAIISSGLTSPLSMLMYTDGTCYPETFNSANLVFSGTYQV